MPFFGSDDHLSNTLIPVVSNGTAIDLPNDNTIPHLNETPLIYECSNPLNFKYYTCEYFKTVDYAAMYYGVRYYIHSGE